MSEYASRQYPALPNGLAERLRRSDKTDNKQRNEVLYQAGEVADNLFVVQRGVVYSRRRDKTMTLVDHVFHPGQMLGIEAAVRGRNYSSDAVAANEVEIVRFNRKEINDLTSLYPLYFMQLVTYHIRELEELQDRFKLPIAQRVEIALDEFKNGNKRVCVDQSVIAERSGVDRRYVNATLANKGIIWEEVVDLSLLRVSKTTIETIEKLVKKYLIKTKKEEGFMGKIVAEANTSINVVRLVMNQMGVHESDFDLTESERTRMRILRTIEKCKDISGKVNVTQAYIANRVGVSVETVIKALRSSGQDWTELTGKDSRDVNTRVIDVLEEYKDDSGRVRFSKNLLALAAGVSERTFVYALQDLQINWSDIAPRRSKKRPTPETIKKVKDGIASMSDDNGLVSLTREDFSRNLGIHRNTVTNVLSALNLRWRDIADPRVYKE